MLPSQSSYGFQVRQLRLKAKDPLEILYNITSKASSSRCCPRSCSIPVTLDVVIILDTSGSATLDHFYLVCVGFLLCRNPKLWQHILLAF